MTDLATGPVFTEDYWSDPWAVFARLREHAPVREVDLPEGGSSWLVTRYADVRAAFTDPRLAKDWRASLPEEQRAGAPGLPGPGGHMMLMLDPPDHTRLRRLVVQAFTVRRVAALRPRIEAIAAELLDALAAAPEGEPVDLVAGYALPLPTLVICELLGVPAADREEFGGWSTTMVDDAPQEEKGAASQAMATYLEELVAAKRAAPDDGLVSALAAVSEEGDRLSDVEVVAMGMLLLIAGHETTANLIGNGVAALLADPSLRDGLVADPARIPAAVEEFLRWSSPVSNTPMRFASVDVEMGGTTIPRGSMVMLSLAAANHDPERFDGPELLDPDRETTGHVAFGHGIHFCLGASLARLETEVALRTLLGRHPGIVAAVPPAELRNRRSVLVHGLRDLPVRLAP